MDQPAPRQQPILLAGMILVALSLWGCAGQRPEGVPAGYRLVYVQDFDDDAALDDFVYTDPSAWVYGVADAGGYLELAGESDYQPTHRSPLNIALLRIGTVGSFVLDVQAQQTGGEYGHRDLCLFFGFQDPEHFYYTHLATLGDENAHQVFIVNDAPRTPVTKDRTVGVDWGEGVWRHLRVVRDCEAGTIAIYFDDMTTPVQTAEDRAFAAGYIGFGSFDDTGRFDQVRLWAESMGDQPSGAYRARR